MNLHAILLLEEERGRVLEMGTSAAGGIGAAANPLKRAAAAADGTIRELAAQAAIGHQGATVEWRWWGGG